MRSFVFLLVLLSCHQALKAQFRNISISQNEINNCKIIQIDFRDNSTLFFLQYKPQNTQETICFSDNFSIKDNQNNRSYKLLSSINLPICDDYHVFENRQTINFVLEFEKLPINIQEFNIYNPNENSLNFNKIKIDKEIIEYNYLNIKSFIEETPLKEYGYYFKDGEKVYYYKEKGLMIAVLLNKTSSYGNYYSANILIQNLTGKDINVFPNSFYSQHIITNPKVIKKMKKHKDSKTVYDDEIYGTSTIKLINCEIINDSLAFEDARILTHEEYLKIVDNQQAWTAFAISFSESMAASNAGYSSSFTTSNYSINTKSRSNGYIGDYYFESDKTSQNSVYGESITTNYNGAADYNAQQNANKNISNIINQQYDIRNQLSEGYMKINTINNGTEYLGYINIEQKQSSGLKLKIPINGTYYYFQW